MRALKYLPIVALTVVGGAQTLRTATADPSYWVIEEVPSLHGSATGANFVTYEDVAYAINDAGQIVGTSEVVVPNATLRVKHAFLYSDGLLSDLTPNVGTDTSGYRYGDAYGISPSGVVVGRVSGALSNGGNSQLKYPFVFRTGTLTVGTVLGEARGVNDNAPLLGTGNSGIVGTFEGTGPWGSQLAFYGDLPNVSYSSGFIGHTSHAHGVSDVGLHIAGWVLPGVQPHAFHAHPLSPIPEDADALHLFVVDDLGTLGGPDPSSYAYGVNSSGHVVGQSIAGGTVPGTQAFLYADGGMRALPGTDSPGYASANAINDHDQIVGYATSSRIGSGGPACLWESGQITNLNALIDPALGWDLSEANGINNSGWIVGRGVHSGHGYRAFVMHPATPADRTPPVLTLPPNLTVEGTSSAGATATWTGPTAIDDSGVTPVISCSRASGDLFPLGETTVTCVATDGAGNTALGSFTVTVRDTTPPVFVHPEDTSVVITVADGATGMVEVPLIVAVADACDPAPRSRITSVDTSTRVSGSDPVGSWEQTGDLIVRVRLEVGRAYRVLVASTDSSANGTARPKVFNFYIAKAGGRPAAGMVYVRSTDVGAGVRG